MMHKAHKEKTLVLVKPDGVQRGLVGEIIKRFEQRGLKIVALKMVHSDRAHIYGHYPDDKGWFASVGERTSGFFKEHGINVKKYFGTDDSVEIGKQVKKWLGDYMTICPVIAMVVQGACAIQTVRKLVGHTYPVESLPGTIRGDFSIDTPTIANVEKRVVKNILHASGNAEEAAHEIKHWFKEEEIFDYKRADEETMF